VTVSVDPGTGIDTFDVQSDDSFGASVAGGSISRQLIAPGIGSDLEWAVVDGSFPDGVSLSPSGLLSGTPSTLGLWSVDLSATPAGAPPAAGRMAAATAPLELWGYVTSAPTGDPFPATLTSARARSDSLVAVGFGSGTWSLKPDGSVPSAVSPVQLAADVGVLGLGNLGTGTFPWRWRGLIERGRWLTISELTPQEAEDGWINSCRYDLWDLTQGSPTVIGTISTAFPDIAYEGGSCWGDVSEDGSTIVRAFTPWPEDRDGPIATTIRFASSASGATQRIATVPGGWSLGGTLLAPDGSALAYINSSTPTSGNTLRLTGRSASGDGTRPLPSSCFVLGQSDGWDGGRIIVTCGGAGGTGVGTVDVATGQDLRLVDTDFAPFRNGFVSLSPDGTEIAFRGSAPGDLETINVLDTTQQEVRVLTEPFEGGLLFPLFVP
jgi:hypothetical protein